MNVLMIVRSKGRVCGTLHLILGHSRLAEKRGEEGRSVSPRLVPTLQIVGKLVVTTELTRIKYE